MAEVNSKRVLIGALVGWLGWAIWGMLVNMVFLAGTYTAAMEDGSLLATPQYGFFMPVWFLAIFGVSYVIAWLYAGVRATYGAGPKTAILVGVLVGFGVGFPINFSIAAWVPVSRVVPLWWMLDVWVGAIIAAFLAGMLYRDE